MLRSSNNTEPVGVFIFDFFGVFFISVPASTSRHTPKLTDCAGRDDKARYDDGDDGGVADADNDDDDADADRCSHKFRDKVNRGLQDGIAFIFFDKYNEADLR